MAMFQPCFVGEEQETESAVFDGSRPTTQRAPLFNERVTHGDEETGDIFSKIMNHEPTINLLLT